MAYTAYLTVTGKTQGQIKGAVTQKGRENTILVHSFDVEVSVPFDPASGQATGKRQHQPIVILKDVDLASPRLWSALVTNESLVTCVLDFWVPAATPAGTDTKVYTVSLTNALITSIHEFMADDEPPADTDQPMQEEVAFTYQKIQWTWTDGGITATDDWLAT
jgi:type VI secretion system secreted protein Hcp